MAGETILVVDDRNDSLQFLTEYVLEPNGYRYITARDGARGLELALSASPDLAIMDLKMPKMTGLEVLSALREREIDLPVILMTFHGSEETAVNAFRLGARDYVIKPYDTAEMIDSIDRALREVRLRRERDQLTDGLVQVNRQLEQRVKELNILYRVSKSVTSLLDLDDLLNRIVEAGLYVTSAEEGALFLLDRRTGNLYMRAGRGVGDKAARGFRVKVQDTIAGQVVRTGEPYRSSADEQTLKVKTNYLVRSLAYVPLKLGETVIGVLMVDNRRTNTPFTENDVYLLSALADYAAIAIDNARLYGTVKRFNAELEKRVQERTAELRAAQAQLVQAEKLASIGQLAAGVAHEINNPIGVILGFAQVLRKRLPEEDALYVPMRTIEREGLRCKEIVQDLLDFARQGKPVLGRIQIDQVIDAALDLMPHHANWGSVQVCKDYAPGLPAVLGDENQLQQVFLNIILNAYQAMPDGGTLHLSTHANADQVHAILVDTGPGIAREHMHRVFDPFFTTKDVGEGTGLGLSISYGIVEQHGGTIEVQSEPGVGTTFVVRLPIAPAPRG
ncbi:MAG: response regulator [Anaerolineae bacterium]|nr:response regulator [Anaerolineae bacterium]